MTQILRHRFSQGPLHIDNLIVEDLIDGVKILSSPNLFRIVIVTTDFSRAVRFSNFSIKDIKGILKDVQSIDEVFEHLEWLKNHAIVTLPFAPNPYTLE